MTAALAPRAASPPPTRSDTEHALDLLDTLVDGFEFATPLDRAVAKAALITAVVRPRLRTAPMFVVGPIPPLTKEIARSVFEIRMADPGFDPAPRAGRYRDLYRAAAEDIAGPGSEWSDVVRAPLVALGLPDPVEALGRLPGERINR